ncbi:hypothetical protein [Thermobispora bispora]|uniref:Integral membrane protein n=1 Tax=Thermobispora bispora (strain ATCC 19993 / DSM 43833 / CBS 139.67 / JCM 10125 / KCTC 9307 / NBRC 14880 / R51) TaxID=469371 RepID=D6Y385_THEBD|nr:hypothetical protein [Thermobispora bispora]ADG88960.1 hypothetical protein Tbis_2250 [Thermobispora bispora DSM 43833]MBO2474685.1 hypothetical protein [Actinomycetales bacterium]MBX6169532.1 hypothetical protein [Thermobispora bispora]MDI9582261.1 hypothetical protein [Thermobispora sp.]
MKRLIGAVVAVTLLGALFVTSFLGAFRQPEPHDVPIAVVGPDQVVARLEQQVAAQAPGAFDLIGYPDAAAARQALLDREVDAVLAPQERTLTVASAAGRTGAAIITAAFQAAIPGLTVQDAVPLPPGDPGGVAGMFYLMGLLIPGIVLAVLVTRSGARPAARLGALLGGALVIGTANALLADVVFGALPDRLAALAALSAGIVAALGLVVAGLARTVGLPGVPVATLLFFPIGLPASGGLIGPRFIPEWYAAVGQVLPLGPAAEALRNTVFFDGAALARPLAVLGGWALLGLVLHLIPVRRRLARPVPAPAAA